MCLAIPMRIQKLEGDFAWVTSGRLRRKINIQLVPKAKINDYIIVHAGFAIQIIDQEAAGQTLSLIEQIQ